MRIVKLTEEEKAKLEYLYKTGDNAVVRRRSLSLLLSNDRYSMKSICSITHVERSTLYHLYNAWEAAQGEYKYTVLSIAEGRGAKVKQSAVKEQIKDMLREHNRNLNPILHQLETEHHIKVCKLTLQNFFKDAGL
jgi:transposase